MEQEDSYSYPFPGFPKIGTALLSQQSSPCLQKRSIQELYKRALFIQYLKCLPVATAQKDPTPAKRTKPPVPKFEDSSYKKVKTESNSIQIPMNTVYPSGYACGSDRSNSAHKVKVIKVIPETQSYNELAMTSSFGKINVKQEELGKDCAINSTTSTTLSLLSFKAEEKDNVQLEKISEGHVFPEIPTELIMPPCVSPTSPTSSNSSEPELLDKKDQKKLQKFTELCQEYQKKLNITDDTLIFEKFKHLAALVIPNLVSHFKSKPFEAIAAAILLYACREVDHPITLKQIVAIADSKEKLINKCVFSLKEIIPTTAEVKRFKAGEFIGVLAEKLKLRENVKVAAEKILANIERLNFIKSIHAVTLAACCLKFACSLSDSDQEFETLALHAGITKMTLKNMYRELFPYRMYFITADCMLRDPKDLKL